MMGSTCLRIFLLLSTYPALSLLLLVLLGISLPTCHSHLSMVWITAPSFFWSVGRRPIVYFGALIGFLFGGSDGWVLGWINWIGMESKY